MKILLPVDLVHSIEPTIDLLSVLCNLKEAEVRLLYVRELLPAYENVIKTSGSFTDDWEKKLEAKARESLDAQAQKLRGLVRSVTTEVTSGPPAAMICEVAADEEQELLVVTPGHHKVAERVFTGSISARVVDGSPVPVLVGRPSGNHTDSLKNVLIGFDGSENGRYAIERAVNIFRLVAAKSKVTVVHSVDVAEPVKLLSPVEFVASIEQNLLMAGETYLAQAEKILSDAGVKNVDCCLIEGDPAHGLIKMADDSEADLVIIGAKGHGKIADVLLGSVAHKVAVHTTRSVAIIKPESIETDENE